MNIKIEFEGEFNELENEDVQETISQSEIDGPIDTPIILDEVPEDEIWFIERAYAVVQISSFDIGRREIGIFPAELLDHLTEHKPVRGTNTVGDYDKGFSLDSSVRENFFEGRLDEYAYSGDKIVAGVGLDDDQGRIIKIIVEGRRVA